MNYHIIFCPKRRRRILVGRLKERLESIIGQVADEHGWDVVALGVMSDHLHLFISVDPNCSPNSVVKAFKGRSSRFLREECPELMKMSSLWPAPTSSLPPEMLRQRPSRGTSKNRPRSDHMLLTFNLKHGRDFSGELAKARQVALFAVQNRGKNPSSKDVKNIGLPSAIANQVLRKYGRSETLKVVRHVKLTVPGQGVKHNVEQRELYVPCLKLLLDVRHLPNFKKVNQVEVGNEYAHVSVTIDEVPLRQVEHWMGIDLNSTSHIAVVGNPSTGKVQKYGKEAPHIHKKYGKMRRHLYILGHPRVAKKKLKRKEKHKVKDLNHKISREIVNEAAQQACGIKMEKLSDIRKTARQSMSSRESLHSWSFYQLQSMIEYKAKLLGIPVVYVDPAYTSQQCSRCGLLGTRKGKDFSCPHCGHVDHADANASFNIALRPSLEESVGRLHQDRDWCKGRIDTPQEAPS